jgi:hypothetical protein
MNKEIGLIKNYPSKGVDVCAQEMGLPSIYIKKKVVKLKLKLNKETKYEILSMRWGREAARDRAIYEKMTITINEQMAYILGLIWADGHIRKSSRWRHIVTLTLVEGDAVTAFRYLPKEWGVWNFYHQKPQQPNAKPQIRADLTDKHMFNFFVDTGYLTKSGGNQDLILARIPKHLHHYFWLGYIDGDGCFYLNKTANQMSIASTHDQDWSSVEKWLTEIGVERFKVQKGVTKLGRHSKMRVVNRRDLHKIVNYLYQDYDKNHIGMERKYLRAKEILGRTRLSTQDISRRTRQQ